MPRIESETKLVEHIRQTLKYKYFLMSRLPDKIKREEKAWSLLKEHRGNYTIDLVDKILYIVDYEKGVGWWFGKMIASNKKKILETPTETLSSWIDYVCFSGKPVTEILDKSLGDMHINGAGRGLVTLLLYLAEPTRYSIWVKATHEGLLRLGRINERKDADFGTQYVKFNEKALEFARIYDFNHRELDFILFIIGRYVTCSDGYFCINIS